MSKSLRIATWNLERPRLGGWKKNPAIIEQLHNINADIWVLTETHSVINPGEAYTGVATDYFNTEESCSTVWSRYPIKYHLPTFNSSVAVCVEVESPVSNLVVYGTIITWANDKGSEGKSKKWEEHYKSITSFGEDWAKLRQRAPLCVAGDFNETLSGPTGYGTHKGRALLSQELQRSNLICVTAEIDYNIDHICLSPEWAERVIQVNRWQGFNSDGKPVSDHNGVSVDLIFD